MQFLPQDDICGSVAFETLKVPSLRRVSAKLLKWIRKSKSRICLWVGFMTATNFSHVFFSTGFYHIF